MDDNANGIAEAVDEEDLNTTAPNPPDEWRMPEPVFRKTSGRLPQGFEKELENARAEHAALDSAPGAPDSAHLESKPKNSTLKLVLVILGLAAMIAFIAVFLTVVYFFFLR